MLDDIVWGNPTRRFRELLNTKSIFDKHLVTLLQFNFPKNSSKATQEELNQLVDYANELNGNDEYIRRYRYYDESIERVFADVIQAESIDGEAINAIDTLFDETLPLLAKLKYHFQRPRPYQLARAYKLRLFPYESCTSMSPSYPSGHTLQATLICHVLGNYYPEKFDYFEKLAKDIEYSRLYLGLHYQSDNDFSHYCAELITKDKDFKAKYSL